MLLQEVKASKLGAIRLTLGDREPTAVRNNSEIFRKRWSISASYISHGTFTSVIETAKLSRLFLALPYFLNSKFCAQHDCIEMLRKV
jgi:hypothetical protein